MYGIYIGEKVDLVNVLWDQFVHSSTSTSKNTEISCAGLWPIVVKNACDHYHVSQTEGLHMDLIPRKNINTYIC